MLNAARQNGRTLVIDDRPPHNLQLAESSGAISAFGDLESAQIEILHRLVCTIEHRDDDTARHTHCVGELAAMIARSLDFPKHGIELIRIAAPLHDIGKIGIPDKILLKPEKLTAEEYETIKTHTKIGSAILSGGRLPFLQMAERIALYHHERWDGKGYWGVLEEAIPVEARIVSVADTFDVLTHRRPYKQAWSVRDAVAEINSQSGRQFDPHIVDAFTRLVCSDGSRALSDPAGKSITSTRSGLNICNATRRYVGKVIHPQCGESLIRLDKESR
jgi:HD-GYP domain-containing protein (c-di-GMP phosphodiesterase class II)